MNGGDDAKLRALIERLARAARGDLARDLRRALAARTREEIARAFVDRRAPDGTPWRPTKAGRPPLVREGALRAGFDVEQVGGGIAVTNRVPYANVHQRGARIRRRRRGRGTTKRRLAFGGRVAVIPARPMVPARRWGPTQTARLRAVASRIVRRSFPR